MKRGAEDDRGSHLYQIQAACPVEASKSHRSHRLSSSDILGQIVEPEAGGFSAELTNHVLLLRIPPTIRSRSTELSDKAQQGTLSADEQAELDACLTANTLLVLLKPKARVSLRPRGYAA